MNEQIAIIRRYAQDSIQYGKKSGNQTAINRGDAVILALGRIEKELEILNLQVEMLNIDLGITDMLNAQLMEQSIDLLKYKIKPIHDIGWEEIN